MPYDMLFYSFPIDSQDSKEIDIQGYEDAIGVCHVGLRADFHKELLMPPNLSRPKMRNYEKYCDEDGFIRIVTGEYLYDC